MCQESCCDPDTPLRFSLHFQVQRLGEQEETGSDDCWQWFPTFLASDPLKWSSLLWPLVTGYCYQFNQRVFVSSQIFFSLVLLFLLFLLEETETVLFLTGVGLTVNWPKNKDVYNGAQVGPDWFLLRLCPSLASCASGDHFSNRTMCFMHLVCEFGDFVRI